MQKSKGVLVKYNDIIMDQLEKGIIEQVTLENDGKQCHYLPHHCVVKEDNSATKLRIVYDASAKQDKRRKSLN